MSVLKVEHLSKQFEIGEKRDRSFSKDLYAGIGKLLGRKKPNPAQLLWALKDVNFTLEAGDVMGIIGRNGAGKSTLLKILSEITPPTEGRVSYKGQITSILDVGTGFHPDLTGRQNVFLGAEIVGMDRKEVRAKFDEIVAFSGIEKFIDTPVKHYSSGMYLRLAFSVAFHTDMDILLLDEVLSVGDVDFRMKSTRKIKEIADSGTTVVLVSHELISIRSLCNKCMLLDKGEVVAFGPTQKIVEDYLGDFYDEVTDQYTKEGPAKTELIKVVKDHPKVRFLDIQIQAKGKAPEAEILMDDSIELRIRYEKKSADSNLDIILNISDFDSIILSDCPIWRMNHVPQPHSEGIYEMCVSIPKQLFHTGIYFANLFFVDTSGKLLELPYLKRFQVHLPLWERGERWNESPFEFPFRPELEWKLKKLDD